MISKDLTVCNVIFLDYICIWFVRLLQNLEIDDSKVLTKY